MKFMKEGLDNYPNVVKQIDDKHRIIRCVDNIQYISQIRTGGKSQYPWRSESFYTTLAGANRQVKQSLTNHRALQVASRPLASLTRLQSYPYREAALSLFETTK